MRVWKSVYLIPFIFCSVVMFLGSFYNSNLLSLVVSFLIFLFSFFVGYSQSIVLSVLALIGLASTFSLTLFGFGVSFLAVLYLAVYIGAVAVFFLFVVMMTDLSDEELLKTKNLQQPGVLSVFVCFCLAGIFTFIMVGASFFNNFKSVLFWDFINSSRSSNMWNFLVFDANIEEVARILFMQNTASFIILSIVILIALVGAILLTSSINLVDKHELFFTELDPLNSIWEEERLGSFGDGKPQNMDVQLARTTTSSVNLNRAKYF